MKAILEEFVSDFISNCVRDGDISISFDSRYRDQVEEELNSYLIVWIARKQQKTKNEMNLVLEDMKKKMPVSQSEANLIQQFIDMAYPI